jgi:hypothetical protein
VQHLVLDSARSSAEIGNQVVSFRVQTDHDGVGQELSDPLVVPAMQAAKIVSLMPGSRSDGSRP